jgi:hypothetical protein
VLAFDYRRLGESGGKPRLVLPVADQLADWHAAISFACGLSEVDPARLAIWGFSASGGHVLKVAARDPRVTAAIAQTPSTDGLASSRNQARHQAPAAMLRFTAVALADTLGGLAGRPPQLVPLAGPPGTVAVLTTPDAQDAGRALDPNHQYPDWRQEVAARSAIRLATYSPGRDARRVRCPLLVVVCDQDQSALAAPAAGPLHVGRSRPGNPASLGGSAALQRWSLSETARPAAFPAVGSRRPPATSIT